MLQSASSTEPIQDSNASKNEVNWQSKLPAKWRDAVDTPLYFHQYREYEILAERTVGYDEDDRPSYIAHEVILTRLATDDDEEYYEAIAFREEMNAWRMRDGRWLVLRNTHPDPCSRNGAFYAIHPDIPR